MRQWLPGWDPSRLSVTGCPVDRPPQLSDLESRPLGRPLRIGISGRLSRHQKRLDRLPDFCAALRKHSVDFRLELAGEGPERERLEKTLESEKDVVFLGRLEGDAYWAALAQWDVIVFVSEYEGTPISLIEAMSVGVLPLYPRIGSGGEAYAAQVHPDCVYASEDFDALARMLIKFQDMPPAVLDALRRKAISAVDAHTRAAYFGDVADFARRINALPRRSSTTRSAGAGLMSWCTLRGMGRLGALRRRLRSLASR